MTSQTKRYLDELTSIILFFSVPVLFLYFVTSLFSWGFHAHDKATLIVFPMHIASRQEEYNNIMEQTRMLDEGGTEYRMNADSPVAALVEARDLAARRLRDTKANQVIVLYKIIARCHSPWGFVVAVVDDVTCAEYEAMKF